MDYRHVTHESIPPFINANSKVLILGSLPSVKSLERSFFYAHPQNRFFKTLASIFNEEEPKSNEDRKIFLDKHCIALYDVIYECDICGSSDSSIKNVVPINLKQILNDYPNIKLVCLTGNKAKDLYMKYLASSVNVVFVALPSTSPANAGCSQQRLIEEYKKILSYLN